MLLGEKTSGNHQAYRRGHLDITIFNEIKASTLFLKVGKLKKLVIEAGRQFQTLSAW